MSQALDKQLHFAIDQLNDKQKKAVLGMVTAFIDDGQNDDHWKNAAFVEEMESRYNYYKNGGKMISADEANRQIKELLQKARGK